MRGVFAAGVLDAFLLAGYDPFDAFYGVSAGAWIRSPPEGVEVTSIAPPGKLLTSRTSTRLGDLIADYRLGRKLGERHVANTCW